LEQEMLSPPILSTKEIIEAASHFDEEDRHLYFGAEANEEILKNMSKKEYQVVHFACHGIIDDENPIRSALLLSRKTEIEDGYLQVREIYDLSIRTNLVVLSACRSASGLVENFEGVMGLPRVFFYSGAQSVLSTLWRIEDKPTSLFMSEFFKILSLGVSKARALRIAKKKMLLTKYKNPYYWAGFILSGECESSVYFH
jgi:CHAT domain-containing protein